MKFWPFYSYGLLKMTHFRNKNSLQINFFFYNQRLKFVNFCTQQLNFFAFHGLQLTPLRPWILEAAEHKSSSSILLSKTLWVNLCLEKNGSIRVWRRTRSTGESRIVHMGVGGSKTLIKKTHTAFFPLH